MLIGDGYVVASPTKTGARSLAHLARTNPQLGLRYVPRGHRMTVPRQFAHYERHMIVRDPYERLASIYHFLRRRVGDWGHAAARRLTLRDWICELLARRRFFDPARYNAQAPSIWLATQADCWRILRGSKFWRLDSIGDFFAAKNIDAKLPRKNVGTGDREIPQDCLARVWDEWARDDCELFGFRRR